MTDIDKIIAGLTKAQRGAVLAFSDEDRAFPGHYAKAKELGVSGATLRSLYGVDRRPIRTRALYRHEG